MIISSFMFRSVLIKDLGMKLDAVAGDKSGVFSVSASVREGLTGGMGEDAGSVHDCCWFCIIALRTLENVILTLWFNEAESCSAVKMQELCTVTIAKRRT